MDENKLKWVKLTVKPGRKWLRFWKKLWEKSLKI